MVNPEPTSSCAQENLGLAAGGALVSTPQPTSYLLITIHYNYSFRNKSRDPYAWNAICSSYRPCLSLLFGQSIKQIIPTVPLLSLPHCCHPPIHHHQSFSSCDYPSGPHSLRSFQFLCYFALIVLLNSILQHDFSFCISKALSPPHCRFYLVVRSDHHSSDIR